MSHSVKYIPFLQQFRFHLTSIHFRNICVPPTMFPLSKKMAIENSQHDRCLSAPAHEKAHSVPAAFCFEDITLTSNLPQLDPQPVELPQTMNRSTVATARIITRICYRASFTWPLSSLCFERPLKNTHAIIASAVLSLHQRDLCTE